MATCLEEVGSVLSGEEGSAKRQKRFTVNFMVGDLQNLLTWITARNHSPFSQGEMRRQSKMRRHMEDANLAPVCSHPTIIFVISLASYTARVTVRDGVDPRECPLSPAIDGGQPWRRSFADNLTYTDWQRDNYFSAKDQLIPKRLGIELDHVNLDLRRLLEEAFPHRAEYRTRHAAANNQVRGRTCAHP